MTKTHQNILEKAGLKQTKQRHLILDILSDRHEVMSADDIFLKAKTYDETLSLSTVYRVLESFVSHGIVQPLSLDHSKQVLYERAHEKHAHHLICLGCKKVVHIDGCPLGDYEDRVANRHEFMIEEHTLNFYGYCKDCLQSATH